MSVMIFVRLNPPTPPITGFQGCVIILAFQSYFAFFAFFKHIGSIMIFQTSTASKSGKEICFRTYKTFIIGIKNLVNKPSKRGTIQDQVYHISACRTNHLSTRPFYGELYCYSSIPKNSKMISSSEILPSFSTLFSSLPEQQYSLFKMFRCSFSETIPMFFNRLKSDFILVRSPQNFHQ